MESALVRIAERSSGRLLSEMERSAPFLAGRMFLWLEEMFGGASLAERFLHPAAFPILHLPWWVEESFSKPDEKRQEALGTSSMAGYLFIRLIDNIMDGDGPGDPRLLPALAFLSTVFTRPYREWFPSGHPFWSHCDRAWVGTADLTARDADLAHIDLEAFETVSARKTGSATIPVAAMCHVHGRVDRLGEWEAFVETFGRFHQLSNDLHSWRRDTERGATTWVLSEAARHRKTGESVAEWLLREGLDRSLGALRRWMVDLEEMSVSLGSPGVRAYVAMRGEMLEDQTAAVRRGVVEAEKLASLLAAHTGRLKGSAG